MDVENDDATIGVDFVKLYSWNRNNSDQRDIDSLADINFSGCSTNGNNAPPLIVPNDRSTSESLSKNDGLSAEAITGIVIGPLLLHLLVALWLVCDRSTPESLSKNDGLSTGAIAGIVIGLLLVFLIVALWLVPRRIQAEKWAILHPFEQRAFFTTSPQRRASSSLTPPVGNEASLFPLRRQPGDCMVALSLRKCKHRRARSPSLRKGGLRALQYGTSDGVRATSPHSTHSTHSRPSMAETASGSAAYTGPASTSGASHSGSSSDPAPTAPLLPAPSAAHSRPPPSSRCAADAHIVLARPPSVSLSLASARATIHIPSSPDQPTSTATTRPREKRDRTHAPSAMPPLPSRTHTPGVGAEDDPGSSRSLRTTSSGLTEYSVDGGVRLAGGRPGEDVPAELPPHAVGAPTRARVVPPPYSDVYAVAGERPRERGSGGEGGASSGVR
ncbi:uncharacterized protein BXZ73DRAFT_100687 [Epithele typhae]|uniref:uncharacterized protein n=1 Tax=Epithele typhae TaxID=378194 RepID=UPI0020075C3D|nr:uncharacterized protein BXZ73DRAFT_100687 [Epithele typhae]KAH9934497.1 hypothetical protein BXZ73DRAFT_100687 [Epithele typhae]